jgi:glutamate dehydrogenase
MNGHTEEKAEEGSQGSTVDVPTESLRGLLDHEQVGAMCDAASQGHFPQLQAMIVANANVNARDYDHRTPLHLAAGSGSLACVQFLVEKSAMMQPDRFGSLPIHDAIRYGHGDIVNCLREVRIEGLENSDQAQVFHIIAREGIFSLSTVQIELDYFWRTLGLPQQYFKEFTLAQIAHHVTCFLAAKTTALTTRSDEVRVAVENARSALYMSTLEHSRSSEVALAAHLHRHLTSASAPTTSVYLVSYLSNAPAVRNGSTPLVLYATEFEDYAFSSSKPLLNEDDLNLVGSRRFLRSASPAKMHLYQRVMYRVLESKSAVIAVQPQSDSDEDGCVQVLFASYEMGGRTCLHELCQVFRSYDMHPPVMMVESFANGAIVYDMQLPAGDGERLQAVVRSLSAISFLAAIPPEGRPILDAAMDARITFGHAQWMVAVAKFCAAFYPKESPEYLELRGKLRADPGAQADLDAMYLKSVSDKMQEDYVYEVLAKHLQWSKRLYEDFKQIGTGATEPFFNEVLAREIEERAHDANERCILLTALKFMSHLRCTNFFRDAAYPPTSLSARGRSVSGACLQTAAKRGISRPSVDTSFLSAMSPATSKEPSSPISPNAHGKSQQTEGFIATVPSALAYRFDPSFLKDCGSLFPEIPYGIYLVVGREFHAFHVRFRDVARGGIRIVLSRNPEVYRGNCSRLFEEAYNLAYTQQKKNKDIPEGGAKGAILLLPGASEPSQRGAFLSYIDALLDCMGCASTVHSWLPSQEILFFGPDENTAGFMELGALRAKRRGYQFWKSITTGKPVEMGGIPHDVYGMTTASVRTYVNCLLDRLGLAEESLTKVQTGGPDGDLGSNEILTSKDRTVAVVDGSGVAYDPDGLNREELVRLAKARKPIAQFNRERLRKGGFLVTTDDNGITLPDGNEVRSGVAFRDSFHLGPYAG